MNGIEPMIQCPVCETNPGRVLFVKKGRSFYQCRSCSLRLQWPLPTQEELSQYYDREFSQGMYRDFTDARDMKMITAKTRLQKVLAWVPPRGRWLDVGCADGVFVAAASAEGIDASGVELSEVAVEQAKQHGLDVSLGRVEDLPSSKKFDCVTGFDVIEHVIDPRQFLVDIRDRMQPNAICVLSLPNVKSLFASLMGKNWWFYIPEEHLHYFCPKTIRMLAEKLGFEVLHTGRATKPLTFEYGLTQFKEFNPLIHTAMNASMKVMPRSLRTKTMPFYIGEMMVVLRKFESKSSFGQVL